MFEIWWKDRLIDVVPAVGEVPAGLTVRSRDAETVEKVPGELPDWRFSKVLAMCLLTFIACVAVMTLTPVGEGGADDGLFNRKMLTRFVAPPIPEKVIPKLKSLTDDKVKQLFASKSPVPSKSNSKAKVASLLGALDEGMKGLFGGGNNNIAIDDALGRLGGGGGPSAGVGFGGMGNGPRGPGAGMGPGLGIGGPGARRPGGGGPNLGNKKDEGPSGGPTHISDGLDRGLVAKVIRAHFNEIKFCYERELQHTPGLAGKVGVSFVIGGTGEVIEAAISESTLDNATVEDCMLSRVRRWKFPEPAGGGTVEVNHPWIFRGAGDNDP